MHNQLNSKKSPVWTAYFKETIVPTSRSRGETAASAELLISVCVSSCLWPTAGETVLAEGKSGTRAYVWQTLSLTVEVSKGLFFTSWTEPTDADTFCRPKNHTLYLCILSAVFCLSLLNTYLLLIKIKRQYVKKNLIKIKQDQFLISSRE